ncbi:hypothetical protein Salat_0214000 [Sesamum alatum]|uniref:Uncharacterized protein n=1 Tax=Sesamum alatum TaxID=300844 RepID=A0AAE1YYH4_9LAMI|nr:hypothetical protein Salat_0214000 [Sesamum alatum]
MLAKPSKNRYLDDDHWKRILPEVTGEDVVWRPYERLQHEQSQMPSLELQRIFFTASVLFDYQLINYHMPKSTPLQLGIERPLKVLKRYRKKLKTKGKDGHTEHKLDKNYKDYINWWNKDRYHRYLEGRSK